MPSFNVWSFHTFRRAVVVGAVLAAAVAAAPPRALRVCADPNNLPFSNEKREGFENRIAELVGRELGLPVQYTWWAQRRGYVRNTLKAGSCDLYIGVPTGFERVLVTRPYYRSTYVFVTRRDGPRITSFDDPQLKRLRIGVQLIGDDYANTPPVQALSQRGIVKNVQGYTVIGNYLQPNPPARIIRAVEKGEVDVGIAWGPLAGFFGKRARPPLRITPVQPQIDTPYLPFVFDIAMGVRHGDTAFRNQLDGVLLKRRTAIDRILSDYAVPRADTPAEAR